MRYGPQAAAAADRLVAGLRERPRQRASTRRTSGGWRSTWSTGCAAAGCTLATAESCTAGLVAARVANVPGASDVLLGGIVAYANEVKLRALGVPEAVLREHGAVSARVRARDGRGRAARRWTPTSASSVTGIAGPGRRHAGQAGRPGVRLRDRSATTSRPPSTASATAAATTSASGP